MRYVKKNQFEIDAFRWLDQPREDWPQWLKEQQTFVNNDEDILYIRDYIGHSRPIPLGYFV